MLIVFLGCQAIWNLGADGNGSVEVKPTHPYPTNGELRPTEHPHPFGEEVFKQVSVGGDFACGLKFDGHVVCLGYDATGETHPPTDTFASIYTGWVDSCGLHFDGTLTCWGAPKAPTPPVGPFIDVALGVGSSCALTPAGYADCWLGESVTEDEPFVMIEVEAYGCALRLDQSIWCLRPEDSQLASEEELPPVGQFLDIAVGWGFGCAVRTDQSVVCWNEDDIKAGTPSERDFVAVDAHGDQVCAQHQDGRIFCWEVGGVLYEQPSGTYSSFSVGPYAGCGLDVSGHITCWGNTSSWE